MTENDLPEGWSEVDEQHPDHGVVAYCHTWYRHTNGEEIIIWSDVVEDGANYHVGKYDEYAVELYDKNGEYVHGSAYEYERSAFSTAHELMYDRQ